MNKDKFLDTLAFIVGLVTAILAVIFKNNMSSVLFCVGIGGSSCGLLLILKKSNYGYLILSICLSILVTMILYTNKILDKADSITFMITGSVFLLMAISMLFSILGEIANKKRYSLVVWGKVVDLKKNPNTTKEYYQPIYEYVIDDKTLEVAYPRFVNRFIPNVGDKHKIYINPLDKEDVYFEKEMLDKLYDYGVGLFLAIASLFIMISLFR